MTTKDATSQQSSYSLKYRYIIFALIIFALTIISWQTITLAMYCTKYYPTNFIEPYLKSHLIGMVTSLIFGSMLSINYSPNRIFGFSVLGLSISLELSPLSLYYGVHGISTLQFINGVLEAFLMTSVTGVISNWIPKSERTTCIGLLFGIVLISTRSMFDLVEFTFATSPLLYINVLLGISWYGIWQWLGNHTPESHPSLSLDEKILLTADTKLTYNCDQWRKIPWRKMIKHEAVVALIIVSISGFTEHRIGKYNIMMFPFKQFLHTEYTSIGLITSFGFVVALIGLVADFLINKELYTAEIVRKILCSGFLILHACVMLLLQAEYGQWLHDISVAFFLIYLLGLESNYFDIAPQFAPVLKGTILSFVWTFRLLLENIFEDRSKELLTIAATLQLVAAIIFAIFAKGTRQSSWDQITESTDKTSTA